QLFRHSGRQHPIRVANRQPRDMHNAGRIFVLGCALVALASWPGAGLIAEPAAIRIGQAATPANPEAAMAAYRRRLEAYTAARATYDKSATAYWTAIADKRRIRNAKRRDRQPMLPEDYVLTQPPVYAGPPRPVDPSAPTEAPPRRYV